MFEEQKQSYFLPVHDEQANKQTLNCGRVGWQSCQVIVEYVPHSQQPLACIEDLLMAATRQLHPRLPAEIKKLSHTES